MAVDTCVPDVFFRLDPAPLTAGLWDWPSVCCLKGNKIRICHHWRRLEKAAVQPRLQRRLLADSVGVAEECSDVEE